MKPLKKSISITLDEDLIKMVRERAEADDRSVSQYINLVLRAYFRGRERGSDDGDSPQDP